MKQTFYLLGLILGVVFGMACVTSCSDSDEIIPGEVQVLTIDSSALPAGTIDADGNIVLTEGGELTLPFIVEPAELASQLVLTSADPNIAAVEGLKLIAKTPGETKIYAQIGDKTVEFPVVVKQDSPEPGPQPVFTNAMTLEAITAGTITIKRPQSGMKYTLNGGEKISITTTDDVTISVNAGDKVQFYGNGTSITSYQNTTIVGDAETKLYGNIMSLVDETGFETNKTLTAGYCFSNLFEGNTGLKDASNLQLPAKALADGCYMSMFYGCTSLTTTPELPAMTLACNCYESMFSHCSNLTVAPELPAKALADCCYMSMFKDCSSLTAAPALPATTMTDFCYMSMFSGCSSLTTAPELPATTLVIYCYSDMFENCSSLTTAPELPAKILVEGCYMCMFYGCSSLTSITCLATNISAPFCTEYWLYKTATTGTFFKAPEATCWDGKTDANGTNGWTVKDYTE